MLPVLLTPRASATLQSANTGLATPPPSWNSAAAGAANPLAASDSPLNAVLAESVALPAQLAGLPARPGLQGMRKIVAQCAPYVGPLVGGSGLYLLVTSQFSRFGGGNGPAMPVDTYVAQTVAGSLLLGAGSALAAAGIWLTCEPGAVVDATPGAPDGMAPVHHDEESTRPSTPVV